MEVDEGIGSMNLMRYYFDRNHRMCIEFRYRGQGGNRNHFISLPECRKVCPGIVVLCFSTVCWITIKHCLEAPSPCAYGGLGGLQPTQCSPDSTVSTTCSGQQFCHVGPTPDTTVCCNKPSKSHVCMHSIILGELDPCNQPANIGVGSANLQRWFFNSHQQSCQPLVYRGLQGNQNNFLSRDTCETQCFSESIHFEVSNWSLVNPCRVGNPYRNSNGIAYCSATDQSQCPAGFYCHLGANSATSMCCPALGEWLQWFKLALPFSLHLLAVCA